MLQYCLYFCVSVHVSNFVSVLMTTGEAGGGPSSERHFLLLLYSDTCVCPYAGTWKFAACHLNTGRSSADVSYAGMRVFYVFFY